MDVTYEIRLALALLELDGVGGSIEVGGSVSGPYSRPWITADGLVDGRFGDHDLTGRVSVDWGIPDLERLAVKAKLRFMTAFPARAPRTPLDVEVEFDQSRLAARITSSIGAAAPTMEWVELTVREVMTKNMPPRKTPRVPGWMNPASMTMAAQVSTAASRK